MEVGIFLMFLPSWKEGRRKKGKKDEKEKERKRRERKGGEEGERKETGPNLYKPDLALLSRSSYLQTSGFLDKDLRLQVQNPSKRDCK